MMVYVAVREKTQTPLVVNDIGLYYASQGAVTCLYDSVISQGSTSILTVKMLIRCHPVYKEKGSCLSLCELRVQLKKHLVLDKATQTGL